MVQHDRRIQKAQVGASGQVALAGWGDLPFPDPERWIGNALEKFSDPQLSFSLFTQGILDEMIASEAGCADRKRWGILAAGFQGGSPSLVELTNIYEHNQVGIPPLKPFDRSAEFRDQPIVRGCAGETWGEIEALAHVNGGGIQKWGEAGVFVRAVVEKHCQGASASPPVRFIFICSPQVVFTCRPTLRSPNPSSYSPSEA